MSIKGGTFDLVTDTWEGWVESKSHQPINQTQRIQSTEAPLKHAVTKDDTGTLRSVFRALSTGRPRGRDENVWEMFLKINETFL